jgi:uncharacterized protein (DUF2141 family)
MLLPTKLTRISHLCALACGLTIGSAGASDLTIEFSVTEGKAGLVYFSVYDSAVNWLKKPFKSGTAILAGNAAKGVVIDLPAGDYAVTAFHDLNGNGKLDFNFLKIPVEPSGFSNNATGKFGPASFEQARFKLAAASERIEMKLK